MKKVYFLLLMILLVALFVSGLAEGYTPLDMDIKTVAPAPDPNAFTDSSYKDDTLEVNLEKRDIDGVRYNIAWIKVADASQLRTCYAGKAAEAAVESPFRMSKRTNAVLIINGEYYTQRVPRGGVIYRQGEQIYMNIFPAKDTLIIDENGDFHGIINSDAQEILEFVKAGHTIVNGFTFGPVLVKGGEVQQVNPDYYFDCQKPSPRMVIAQVGPLEYVFVNAEGRNEISKGVTHQQMADFMGTLGVQTAYNLDGGNTCVMLFNNKSYASAYKVSEREQKDMIYVCTLGEAKE